MLRAGLWSLAIWCRRLGWGAALSLLTLMAGACAYLLLIQPMTEQSQSLREEAVRLRLASRPSMSKAALSPVDELGNFYEFFPQLERMPDLLDRMYRAAVEQGVLLDRGDYQLSSERDVKLIRYDIALPVKGGYLQVRKFVAQALNDIPSLSLESIVFNRQRINEQQLDVQIKFSLYMRAPA
ncbi:hypothetical protein [Herbaspirillum huttiense]|uniref:hypothetical protein n=1 Tax=Herbaspirillum huttiense TaxID=863372 RepID=UPI002176AC76|nr:hypothetical protein [Herbaspirillum huttiense]UWE14528.1 hypothetical protein NY669_15555 [Herbaspirillum huttiense]